jgi:putative copper resistance protein D
VLLSAASVLGFLARRRVLGSATAAVGGGRATFVKLMSIEAAVLAVAVAVGVALATSPRPKLDVQFDSLGESLAGFAFPPPPTVESVALTIQPDPVFLVVCAILAITYIAGVVRLLRRGDTWPWGRTISWILGVLALLWCTNAGISQYANITPGLHMAQHMALTMLVPILLVLGGPVTLALRAIRPSTGTQWGPREWIVYALHSRAAVILTNPLVVLAIYFVGLYGLYLSSLFGTLMGSHVGHVAMQAHFIVSGYLFYWVLIGVDPRPRFLPYWQRFLILVMSSAFHGFFAVIIMMSEAPIAVDWFTSVQPPWMTDLSVDTVSGGQAAWAIGEFPILVVAIALCIQWARSDERDAKRTDRQADRDGDKELIAYNAYLARLGQARPRGEAEQ